MQSYQSSNNVLMLDFDDLKPYAEFYDDELLILRGSAPSERRSICTTWVTILMARAGESDYWIDNECRHVHAGDILVVLPGKLMRPGVSALNFRFRCLCISRRLLDSVGNYSGYNWDIMTFLNTHPVITPEPSESGMLSSYFLLLREKLSRPRTLNHSETMRCLLQAFIYDFSDVLDRFVSVGNRSYSSGRNLFRNFLRLLTDVYPRPRSVSYYAERLHVTPKYLSSVCKEQSTHTASALIHKAVLDDITRLLQYSDKSIKEIMIELDFPTLSFFGKYVKKHLGMSPKDFRNRLHASSSPEQE